MRRTALTWGCNANGALGDLSTLGRSSTSPLVIPSLLDPARVICGWGHTAALSTSGRLYLAGRALDGRNVLSFGRRARFYPGVVETWTKYLGGARSIDFKEFQVLVDECTQVSAGFALTLGVVKSGHGFGLGTNRYAQTGCGEESRSSSVPAPTPFGFEPINGAKFVSVHCGNQFACALDSNGLVYSWGKGERGQLGCGEVGLTSVQRMRVGRVVEGIPGKAKSVSCGFNHSCVLTEDGQVFIWGKHHGPGQTDALVPRPVNELKGKATHAVCGQFHTVIRDELGNVYQFGMQPDTMGGETARDRFVEELVRVDGGLEDAFPPNQDENLRVVCGFGEAAFVDTTGKQKPLVWDWSLTPKPLPELENRGPVVDLSFGWRHKAAIVLGEGGFFEGN